MSLALAGALGLWSMVNVPQAGLFGGVNLLCFFVVVFLGSKVLTAFIEGAQPRVAGVCMFVAISGVLTYTLGPGG